METVLIVEPDPLERNLAMQYLTEAGYHVLEAANLTEAAQLASLFEEDLRLVVVPHPLATDARRQIGDLRQPVTFLLTSYNTADILPAFPPAFTFAVLQKPFSLSLVEKVRNVLRKQ